VKNEFKDGFERVDGKWTWKSITLKLPIVDGVQRYLKTRREYKVVSLSRRSETLEMMVVYESSSCSWVRPLSMLTDDVVINYEHVPRFQYVPDASEPLS
jgi:hypothetical protein